MRMKVSFTVIFVVKITFLKFYFFFLQFVDDDEDEDDIIQLPLRSYVESNEEMTESDCNVQEDDERTGMNIDESATSNEIIWRYCDTSLSLNGFQIGGGSASDSGRSIASSVSTEPFFSGQSVATETQAMAGSTAPTETGAQTQSGDGESDAGINNNEPASNATDATTSQAASAAATPATTLPEDASESQDATELKDQENTNNDDNADNNDVINVYSSGDEGMIYN